MGALSGVLVREARPDDISRIIELGAELIERTIYSHQKLDREKVVKTLVRCMNSALGCVLVAEHDGKVVGFLIGVAEELWFTRGRMATDLGFYSTRAGAGLALIRAFIRWAWALPAVVEITMGQSSGIDATRSAAIYKRAGFSHVGGMFSIHRRRS